LLLVGNNYAARAQTGREDAGKGLLLFQNKEGTFTTIPGNGFVADKDARKIARIENFIIVANNNDKIQIFNIH
jgi:enediyne biosynthesis protein E4